MDGGQVAQGMATYLRPADFKEIAKLLWMLSTWLGTLALSGGGIGIGNALGFRSFDRLSVADREKILRNWSLGKPSPALRSPFLLLKIFVLREFYTQVIRYRNRTLGLLYPGLNSISFPGEM
jgi:hypothetical protein